MTTVYFIRHAQSDRFVHDDRTRPLTAEGIKDTSKITAVLENSGISHIISSPYTRTIQTVSDLSEKLGLEIETEEDFRERNAGQWHGENFIEFIPSLSTFGHLYELLEQEQYKHLRVLKDFEKVR